MAAETQYTANTGLVTISTANTNRDGTGTLGLALTATAGFSGTLLKTIYIKAQGSTSEGTVRLFINDGSTNYRLLSEIYIPAMTQASTSETFETSIDLDFKMKTGYKLYASTEVANTFNIIAEALDYTYYSTSVRPESTNYTGNTGGASNSDTGKTIVGGGSSGNSSLTGSGTVDTDIWLALTAGGSGSYKGCSIESLTIKALGNTSPGMIRVFVSNGSTGSSNVFLLTEVFVPAVTASATFQSFGHTIVFPNKLQIKAGYKIYVTCQNNSESYAVLTEAMDWAYPA